MLLADYLKLKRLSQARFGLSIGVTQAAINRYVLGSRMPPTAELVKIHNATGGRVTANDFFRHIAARKKLGPLAGRKVKS